MKFNLLESIKKLTNRSVVLESDAGNSKLPQNIRKLNDKAWRDLLIKSITTPIIDQVEFPGFPSPELQAAFVGSADEATLKEAHTFYSLFKENAKRFGKPLGKESRFLDFGCGWGRYLRFFWKDIENENLYGCDINQSILDTCRALKVPGQLDLIEPEGRLPYPDNHFDAIMAYSVFTHLPERVHLHWMQEFARVARPGCIICLTLEPRRFLDFVAGITSAETRWHKLLSNFKPQIVEFKSRFDAGKFVFMQTNDEVELQDKYGDAVIPLSFIEREWSPFFDVRDYIDDAGRFWQAVLVVQRK